MDDAGRAPDASGRSLPDLERTTEAMPTRLYRVTAEVIFPSPSGGQRKYALATTRIGPRESK